MDIFQKYEDLAVKIECNGIEGSGCLFQPFTTEYTYVLTAKHCLEGYGDLKQEYCKDDIVIRRFTGDSIHKALEVIDYYEHEELDLAVILVEYITPLTETLISIPSVNSSLGIYGYPHILSKRMEEETRQRLPSKITFISKKHINFSPEMNIESYDKTAAANIRGFSGAGLYIEHKNNLFLIGIFTELKEDGGAYNGLQAIKIFAVNEILTQKGLPELFPGSLLSFETYIETAFNRNEGLLKSVLKEHAGHLSDINPKILIDSLKKKLFLPYKDSYEMELLNKNLWEGWISLLTYLYIETDSIPATGKFKVSRKKDDAIQNIKMYFSNDSTMSECVMNLYYEIYDDLNKKDLVVINMDGKTPPRTSYNQANIKNKVLKQIDKVRLYEKRVNIDDPDYHKEIECIHIDLFLTSFSDFDHLESPSKIKKEIKRSVAEVFNNVP